MSNLFNSVKGLKPKRNAFSAHSYRNDYTCNLGQVVPIYLQHVVPNTTVKLTTHALIRLQALIAPVMDNIDYYVHFWQIPYRLLEDGKFTQFVGGEIAPEDYNPPYITGKSLMTALSLYGDTVKASVIGNGSLLDMCGYDSYYFSTNSEIKSNVRNLQSYFFLLLHWYVNEQIMPWSTFQEDVEDFLAAEGDCSTELATLLSSLYSNMGLFFNHGWQKDYFTSALPNVQEGDPVTLSLAGTAPVAIPAQTNVTLDLSTSNNLIPIDGAQLVSGEDYTLYGHVGNNLEAATLSIADESDIAQIKEIQHVGLSAQTGSADLSEASAITINELRVANALQVFKERIMRFGHRSQDYYKGFFNVTPEDLRLQLPKWLGGGRVPVSVADIEQTSSTTSTSPQGNLAGKGIGVAGGFAGFTTFCSEESVIIGVAWLMPKITYSNSMSRMLLKLNDRFDYFNPSFEHLGEQEIQNIEVWSGGNSNEFGYTPRFAEYRFHQNEQHGNFKGNLNFWTLGRIFSSQPALNADFIYMQPLVMQRIFAVTEDSDHNPVPNVLASVKFSVRLIQPMSKYGTPMLLA